jgi:hypothetical protein
MRRPLLRFLCFGLTFASAAAFLVSGCKDDIVHTVRLEFKELDGGIVRGFSCQGKGGRPLLSRAAASRKASLVVDMFQTNGLTRCRYIELLEHCRETSCPRLEASRKCLPLEADFDASVARAQGELAAALKRLEGTLLAKDTPSDTVIVRAVAVAQSCDELKQDGTLDSDFLLGCATSCPQLLTNADLDVLLDLDVSDPLDCEPSVRVCATGAAADTARRGGDAQ